ncbi:MAG: shikimate kinase [Fuerstiella sp.]
MILTLIGYRGCGKSSIAPLIAASLECNWVDSDREIERLAGKSIAQIFAEQGESSFRDLESEVLENLCRSAQPVVIAAGGGAILREQNRIALKAAGPVVWLTADVAVLAERIQQDSATDANRPSLTGAGVVQEIQEVLDVRMPLYQDAATCTVSTDGRTVVEICQTVLAGIESDSNVPLKKDLQ